MKITVTKKLEVEVKTLKVEANVRYWEDSEWNEKEDTEDGTLAICKDGDLWKPIIDLGTGMITNWKQGTKASIHYKIADKGSYYLLNKNNEVVASIEDNYVPAILSPKENGYGDYIIMDINENGQIADFEADLEAFQQDDECDC